jgi:hypothetical protein
MLAGDRFRLGEVDEFTIRMLHSILLYLSAYPPYFNLHLYVYL